MCVCVKTSQQLEAKAMDSWDLGLWSNDWNLCIHVDIVGGDVAVIELSSHKSPRIRGLSCHQPRELVI